MARTEIAVSEGGRHLIGRRPYAELPRWAKGFDVVTRGVQELEPHLDGAGHHALSVLAAARGCGHNRSRRVFARASRSRRRLEPTDSWRRRDKLALCLIEPSV
jgi:hypothetical protein